MTLQRIIPVYAVINRLANRIIDVRVGRSKKGS